MDVNTVINLAILILGFWIVRYIKQQDADKKAILAFQQKTKEDLEEYQKATKEEMNEIKLNYLDRFDEVKTLIVLTADKQFDRLTNMFKHK